jgi:hypothetical protein
MSQPFYCLRQDYADSTELQNVQEITSLLLLAGRLRGLHGTTEGSRHHILSFACGKMTWHPWKYPFYCVLEDDVASQELQKVQDITSFLCLRGDDVDSMEVQKVQDITSLLLLAGR